MLRKTGNAARPDRALLIEVLRWLMFYAVVRVRAAARALIRRRGPAIWFAPDRPHPRYLVRTAALWAGARLVPSPERADIAFYFEDRTTGAPRPPAMPHLNFGCADISKSRVATVFAEVFGYPLAVDPARWNGPAVQKSEVNGRHDGTIVACPRAALPGMSYSHVIDTVRADGFAYDLRTHCIGYEPIVVWVKRRNPAHRFAPPSLAVTRHTPETIFTADELALIARFTRAMDADWCGLDILRDEPTGRLYVVDVNKTDAGPITALSLADKLASTALLADALLRTISSGRAQAVHPMANKRPNAPGAARAAAA